MVTLGPGLHLSQLRHPIRADGNPSSLAFTSLVDQLGTWIVVVRNEDDDVEMPASFRAPDLRLIVAAAAGGIRKVPSPVEPDPL